MFKLKLFLFSKRANPFSVYETIAFWMMASDTEFASIAQSVEHTAVNRGVVGSSPTGGVTNIV